MVLIMKSKLLTIAFTFFSSFSFSQRNIKSPDDLIGRWYSQNKYENTNDSEYMSTNLNIEFLNSRSLRFILPESNPISKLSYLYEIDTLHNFLIIKFYLPEVSEMHKMVLLTLNQNTIKLNIVTP